MIKNLSTFILFILVCILASCQGNDQRDDIIDASLRSKIASLNRQVIHDLAVNDPEHLLSLGNDSMRQSDKLRFDLYRVTNKIHGHIDTSTYHIKKQFYEIRHGLGNLIQLDAETGNEHNYTITYNCPTRKSFVTLGLFEDSIQTIAVLTIFNNYEGEWKLFYLWLSPIRAFGRDAIDWYYRARQQYTSGDMADAVNSIAMCQNLLKPAGEALHYQMEKDMNSLSSDIRNVAESDFKLPIPVIGVHSAPTIIGISARTYLGKFRPEVSYISKLSFSDTAALSKESSSLNAIIGSLFQGLDHNNKVILYHPYQRAPLNNRDTVLNYIFPRNSLANWYDHD